MKRPPSEGQIIRIGGDDFIVAYDTDAHACRTAQPVQKAWQWLITTSDGLPSAIVTAYKDSKLIR